MEDISVVRWVLQTLKHHWARVLMILCASMVMSLIGIAFPLVWQELIDRASTEKFIDRRLAAVFIGLIIIEVLPFLFYLRERFVNQYKFNTRYKLFKHLLRLSIPFHKDRQSTELILQASKGVDAGSHLLRILMNGAILADIPVALFALIFVAKKNLVAGVIFVMFLIVFLVMNSRLGKRMADISESFEKIDNEMTTRSREVLAQIETVKLHRAESFEERRFLAQSSEVLSHENRLDYFSGLFDLLAGLANVLPFCIALMLFLPAVAQGKMTVGMLIAVQIYSVRAVSPAGFLGGLYQDIKRNASRLKPALQLLNEQPVIKETRYPIEMGPLRSKIVLEHITFTYPGCDAAVIRDLSLTIPAGKKVAIVGKTGSGKTTLARLLVRFYDPDRGIVTMDGIDVRQLSFSSLYQEVSYVTQEISILSGTIRENVTYGMSLTDEQIRLACRNAAADFAIRHRSDLDRKVGETGEKLSGGERQRLALARIFLRKPSVIILDEATASLDQLTEQEIKTAFDRLIKMNSGTTLIVIAHRISTVQNADAIVVLDNGSIVDSGSHRELLERCELYRELCQGMTES